MTGPDGKIIRIEANLPEQDDTEEAEEAGNEKRQGRASRIHKLPTTAIEPVPKDYLFRENWRPWLTKQVPHDQNSVQLFYMLARMLLLCQLSRSPSVLVCASSQAEFAAA